MKRPGPLFRLDGQRVLVTGASSGLGQHFAHTLATAGAHVCLAARRKNRLDDAVQSLLVNAFIKVFSERRIIIKNGSRTGYRLLPHSAVCSRICATPVESIGNVRSATRNTFSGLSAAR